MSLLHSSLSRSRAMMRSAFVRQQQQQQHQKRWSTPVAVAEVAAKKAPPPRTTLFAWYSNKLDTHPILTKSITSAFIAGIGDLSCQAIIHYAGNAGSSSTSTSTSTTENAESWWDKRRTGRFFVLGGAIIGPLVHLWYAALATYLPGTAPLTVIKRVCLDQFVFTPFTLPLWLSSLWTLEGTNTWLGRDPPVQHNIVTKLQTDAPGIIQCNWVFWFPACCINFGFVPLKYQVLFSNVASLVWNGFLSFTTSQQPKDDN